MEACATAHHWGRELTRLGHTVKLMPPAYVKPYVKRGKTDAADAEAIAEAALSLKDTEPTVGKGSPLESEEVSLALAGPESEDESHLKLALGECRSLAGTET